MATPGKITQPAKNSASPPVAISVLGGQDSTANWVPGSTAFDINGNPLSVALDGTDATGVTPPAGAVGIRGWLSAIWQALTAVAGSYADRSVSITTANVSQLLAPANASRKILSGQNQALADVWINDQGAAATIGSPSWWLPAGTPFETDSTAAIYVISPVAGSRVKAQER